MVKEYVSEFFNRQSFQQTCGQCSESSIGRGEYSKRTISAKCTCQVSINNCRLQGLMIRAVHHNVHDCFRKRWRCEHCIYDMNHAILCFNVSDSNCGTVD